MIHNHTLRTYSAALLDMFNELEVQSIQSDGSTKTKNIPISFSTREKSKIVTEATLEQLLSGNVNVLPRCSLSFIGLQKTPERTLNKNLKTNTVKSSTSYEYSWNSVPYNFQFNIVYQCRGMNQLSSIIEQIGPMFNPIVNIDVADAQNLNEPTRVPVKLTGMDVDSEEYDETSSNIFLLTVSLEITGSLYPPIREIERIREFKMSIAEAISRSAVLHNWDVDESGELENLEIEQLKIPYIIDITPTGTFTTGDNTFNLIIEDFGHSEGLKYKYNIIDPQNIVTSWTFDDNIVYITIDEDATYESISIETTITDRFGNFDTLDKPFSIG